MKFSRFYTHSILFILCVFSFQIYSQSTYIDKVFSTGTIGFQKGNFRLAHYQDTCISVYINKFSTDTTVGLQTRYILRKSDLSIVDSINLWGIDSLMIVGTGGDIYNEDSSMSLFYQLGYTALDPNVSSSVTRIFKTPYPDKDSLLFVKMKPSNSVFPLYPLFIYNNAITTMQFNRAKDTCVFEKYDFSGNLLFSKTYGLPPSTTGNFPFQFVNDKAYPHPLSDSLFLLGTSTAAWVCEMNKNTLEETRRFLPTWQTDTHLTNSYNMSLSSSFFCNYSFTNQGFSIGGYMVCVFDFQTAPRSDLQSFYVTKDWNNQLIDARHFGNQYADNRAYGYTTSADGDIKVIVGAAPQDITDFEAQEYRKLFINVITPNAVDSIELYGNSNHVGFDALIDEKTGDIFVFSQHNNAWTDGKAFCTVTKIPGVILSIAKQNMVSKVLLYPNPTQDVLKSNTFKQGMPYMIFNTSGQLVAEGSILNQEINVSKLPKGTYVLKVQSAKQNNTNTTATVFVKN